MAKGKYRNTAEAREARETAIAEAQRAVRRVEVLESENADLRATVDRLTRNMGARVQSLRDEWQERVDQANLRAKEPADQLHGAEKAMRRALELLAAELVKRGVDPAEALTGAVDVTGGIIDHGKFYAAEDDFGLAIDVEDLKIQGVVPDQKSRSNGGAAGRTREDVRVSRMRTRQALAQAAILRAQGA